MVTRIVAASIFLSLIVAASPARAADVDTLYRQAASAHQQRDYARSLPLWQKLAEQGVVNAQYNLGQIYYFGDGVAQDYPLAMHWFKRAAAQGDKAAQAYVGSMYQRGDGVPADAVEAHRWFVMNREHHRHHDHDPQLIAWRKQANALIWQRDMAESMARSQQDSARMIAELQRRAAPTTVAADGAAGMTLAGR